MLSCPAVRVAALVALVALVARIVAAQKFDPIVQISNGALQGIEVFNSTQFLGIPYAQPPVGELRFRRPLPPSNWEGVRNAMHFGNDCAQSRTGLAQFQNISEDCLYLNVYVPTNPSPQEGPLPVLVFFYGGSWSWGGASMFIYNGNFLENLVQDLIIVTVNYRLETFGYSASPLLAAEDPLGSTGNAGMQDQRMALTWVSENIAAFGGDPGRVTIYGESAGAGSVSFHLVAEASWHLYNGAIMDSGPPANWTTVSLDLAVAHWNRIVDALGCASSSDSAVLTCMRAQTMETLINVQENANNALVSWSPVVDGVEITQIPPQLVRQGLFNRVPILMGSNHDEGTLLISVPPPPKNPFDNADYIQFVNETVGYQWAEQVLDMYPAASYIDPWWAAVRMFGDVAMSCPVRRNARWMTQAAVDPVPVYMYFYTHVLSLAAIDPWLGVFHGSELVPVWDIFVVLPLQEERTMAQWFGRYWTNFVRYGNPNGPADNPDQDLPLLWPAYNEAADTNINLDVNVTLDVGLKDEECDLWDQIYLAEHPLPPAPSPSAME